MKVRPFRAIRPAEGMADKVASLPYDVYSEKEAREIVGSNPASFLRIVRPETVFPVGTDAGSEEVYLRARDMIDEGIKSGVMIEEDTPCFYIYRQIMNGRAQTGLVACFSVDDYNAGVIKKHEHTRADKEDDRTKHIDICRAQTGLVFLAYKEEDDAMNIIASHTSGKPAYSFTAIDGVKQMVWVVNDAEEVEAIKQAFEQIDCMYIADGHHRSASAAAVCKKRRQADPGFTGDEEYNYFMAVAFPENELLVMPYYRVVRDLNGLTTEQFVEKLEKLFTIERKNLYGHEPKKPHEVAMYLDGIWYKMVARPEILKSDAIGSLDVSMLQENVLGPILGIEDPRTSDRIDFIGGIRGLAELEKRCSEDMKVAFAMHHTTLEELMRIADEGKVMPPKSTWFEPKLQSGLFVHRI
ncbi:MAG: DUF1015 domain-containing protein [Lachnospiraceae bacterium]|nr:DUF1015 domain-containing protein [Lachnospiraceae bacterium]